MPKLEETAVPIWFTVARDVVPFWTNGISSVPLREITAGKLVMVVLANVRFQSGQSADNLSASQQSL